VEAIKDELVGEFEVALYSAALENLSDLDNPLRFNNFAYSMRELIRHVLSRLAPDERVIQCDWYQNETERALGVSRRQRISFAVKGGLSDSYIEEELGVEIGQLNKRFKIIVNELSKHTHIEEDTFGLDDHKVQDLSKQILTTIQELFETIASCREQIRSLLWGKLDSAAVDVALAETILAVDEIAPHHSIEDVYSETIRVERIEAESIHYLVEGTIECELQWGSNSDLRKGDGAVLSESFPFRCHLFALVGDPADFHVDEGSLQVDTESWWDGYYDE